MYQVYLAFGYHNIYDYTEEQFEGAKKFYKLFQLKDNLWGNKRGDIFAWRKEQQKNASYNSRLFVEEHICRVAKN